MNEMHVAKIQPNQTKIVRKVGLSYRYMLLTNKIPINQNKTEIHKSIGNRYVLLLCIIGFIFHRIVG